jgi:hypothetical protein
MHATVFSFAIAYKRVTRSFIWFLLFSFSIAGLAWLSQYVGVPEHLGTAVALAVFGLLIIRVVYDISQYNRISRSIKCPVCGTQSMSWGQDLNLMILCCKKCDNRYYTDISKPLISGQFNIVKKCDHVAKGENFRWEEV